MAFAMFGAGCFWGVELKFQSFTGVIDTKVGYSGGKTENPTYEAVCSDNTGHAEVVRVEFDPSKITFQELLNVFWSSHNPTTLNRQGPDEGTQYRSAIFYFDDEQRVTAEKSKADLEKSKKFKNPVVTFIEPAQTFYLAEEYHQNYLKKRGQGSCSI